MTDWGDPDRPRVGDIVLSIDGDWITRPPERCSSGHLLQPGRMTVGYQPCAGSCHGHSTWTCWCGQTEYGPPLADDCTPLAGAARVR